jgi:hypothetical protein
MIRVLTTLGPGDIPNLVDLRLYADLNRRRVLAVLPDRAETVDVCDAPEGRRWLIHTAHATYRLIPRKGRIWRLKRMRPLPLELE